MDSKYPKKTCSIATPEEWNGCMSELTQCLMHVKQTASMVITK